MIRPTESPCHRRSTLGHFVLLRGNLNLWNGNKQDVIARSCREANIEPQH